MSERGEPGHRYTSDEVKEVFGRDMTEVGEHFERIAVDQRPQVEQAIRRLRNEGD